MDLPQLEVTAGRLLEEKKRLQNIDTELDRLELELKELPRRSEKDKQFYALIGLDWEEPKIKTRKEELEKEKGDLSKVIREAYDTVLKGFASESLVVPLEPNYTKSGSRHTFTYRAHATFPNAVEELTELLGIPVPLKIDDVTISVDKIEVDEADPYFAKMKVVEAFDKVRKAISLKLMPRGSYSPW